TILSELFPTDIRSSATGFAFNIGRSINFVSPIIVGFLAKSFGFFYALSLGAIASIVMSVTIWILPETKGKDISE
ncbi:MAG: MFS transporter, partial [Candidatus Njordarchaeota archaeon]